MKIKQKCFDRALLQIFTELNNNRFVSRITQSKTSNILYEIPNYLLTF